MFTLSYGAAYWMYVALCMFGFFCVWFGSQKLKYCEGSEGFNIACCVFGLVWFATVVIVFFFAFTRDEVYDYALEESISIDSVESYIEGSDNEFVVYAGNDTYDTVQRDTTEFIDRVELSDDGAFSLHKAKISKVKKTKVLTLKNTAEGVVLYAPEEYYEMSKGYTRQNKLEIYNDKED